jgi:hypothetical protein
VGKIPGVNVMIKIDKKIGKKWQFRIKALLHNFAEKNITFAPGLCYLFQELFRICGCQSYR